MTQHPTPPNAKPLREIIAPWQVREAALRAERDAALADRDAWKKRAEEARAQALEEAAKIADAQRAEAKEMIKNKESDPQMVLIGIMTARGIANNIRARIPQATVDGNGGGA